MFGNSLGLQSHPREAITLHSNLKSIFGANMVGLWLGDDIVTDGSNQILSWPARVGPTLYNANSSRLTISTLNGHKQLYNVNTASLAYLTSSGLGKFYTTIGVVDPLELPFSAFRGAVVGNDNSWWLLGSGTTSNWYSAYTHSYRDGEISATAQTGSHIYERHFNFTTSTDIAVGSNTSNFRWLGGISMILCLSGSTVNDTATTAQRTAYLNALRTYYNIT